MTCSEEEEEEADKDVSGRAPKKSENFQRNLRLKCFTNGPDEWPVPSDQDSSHIYPKERATGRVMAISKFWKIAFNFKVHS